MNRLCEEYTTTGNKSLTSWPDNSSYTSVVCKVFKNTNSSTKVVWDADGNVDLPTPALAVGDLSRRARW